MATLLKLIFFVGTSHFVVGQRPFFAGSRPIGYPELANRTTPATDLSDKFGEDGSSSTTQRLPIEALGDRDLVDRLSKLPLDQQPFWFINWQALEANRNKPQTYPLRPSQFAESFPTSGSSNADLGNRNSETSSSNTGPNIFPQQSTTQRLPVEADRELVDRLSKLPKDKQPLWFINWQSQTSEKPNQFAEFPSNSSPNLNLGNRFDSGASSVQKPIVKPIYYDTASHKPTTLYTSSPILGNRHGGHNDPHRNSEHVKPYDGPVNHSSGSTDKKHHKVNSEEHFPHPHHDAEDYYDYFDFGKVELGHKKKTSPTKH